MANRGISREIAAYPHVCMGEPRSRRSWLAGSRVYPRAYGGTGEAVTPTYAHPGLSPRIRGNHSRAPGAAARTGSIPAHTGEPTTPRRRGQSPSVYPRAYGGTTDSTAKRGAWQGLSPRIRGNLAADDRWSKDTGSIPAHTGEPQAGRCRTSPRRVYPRAYGGTSPLDHVGRVIEGLSPRIRGNLEHRMQANNRRRSIPAHTGEPVELRLC